MRRLILLLVLLAAAGGGGAYWWYTLRAPSETAAGPGAGVGWLNAATCGSADPGSAPDSYWQARRSGQTGIR